MIKNGSEIGLRVTVRDETITITLPGTWFTVTYCKLPGFADLVATSVADDRRVALQKADSRSRIPDRQSQGDRAWLDYLDAGANHSIIH